MIIEEDKNNKENTYKRHFNFYWFGRFLFEAIEFYGTVMNKKKEVYHGLDKQLLFSEFSTHFNSPTSTTTSEAIAFNFMKNNGIILILKNCNTSHNNNITSQYDLSQTRYMNVSFISAYSNEDECLFFGNATILEIKGLCG